MANGDKKKGRSKVRLLSEHNERRQNEIYNFLFAVPVTWIIKIDFLLLLYHSRSVPSSASAFPSHGFIVLVPARLTDTVQMIEKIKGGSEAFKLWMSNSRFGTLLQFRFIVWNWCLAAAFGKLLDQPQRDSWEISLRWLCSQENSQPPLVSLLKDDDYSTSHSNRRSLESHLKAHN